MTTTISRLYDDYESARAAASDLETHGVDTGDISIVASNADGRHSGDPDSKDKVKHVDFKHDKDGDGVDDRIEGARTGAGIGGAAAGAAGLAAGLGLLAIPGIGPIVAAGWAASTLAGLVAGGVTGGIVGFLVESGVSKDDANVYAETIRRGGALVVARVPEDQASRYRAILDRSGVNVAARAKAYRQSGWTGFDPAATPYSADQVRREREMYH